MTEEEQTREDFEDLADGAGCVEVWEKLSEKRSGAKESTDD